jgi:hypothetical protein
MIVIGMAVVASIVLTRICTDTNCAEKDFQLLSGSLENTQKADEHSCQDDLVNLVYKNMPVHQDGEQLGKASEKIDTTQNYQSILLDFLEMAAAGEYPVAQFHQIQNLIKQDSDALAFARDLVLTPELSYAEKLLMVELISACSDERAINFAMDLIQDSGADYQSLGEELAIKIMWSGKTADMLEPIAMSIYTGQNMDIAKKMFYGVGNIDMGEQDKNRVTKILSDYLQNGENELKPVALQSLGALVADDEYKVADLFNQYHTSNYSDDVRYSALEVLFNLKGERISTDIEYKLKDIANDTDESYYLRSIAMQLLGNFVESYEKDRKAEQD